MADDVNERLWWQSGVIYQIYPRSFRDSNGDGIGDLAGIIEKLDYLSRDLAIDAIWLSPFYPSPMADFGYDVSDYCNVHPIFGDLATFDKLIQQAHQRGIKLIIDWVPNHTSDQHPWFVDSRSGRNSSKRNWYVWADAKPDGSLPNNWLSHFGGSAWQWDDKSGQYYLHSFLKEQPDLNWRNPEVKAAMLNTLRFWLERGVDGFRIDVAHFIMKDPHLADNPPNTSPVSNWKPAGPFDAQLHINDKGHDDVHVVFREIRDLLNKHSPGQPRFSIGEIHVFDWQKWATYYGKNLDELHMPFNFALIGAAWTPRAVRGVVDAVDAVVPAASWPNYVLGNHDEHRIASRIGAAQERVAMMLLLTLRGLPTVYYGDEIGMHDVPIPPEREQDPWGKNVPGLNLGRDPERTPMQWEGGSNAGFSREGVTPWLPIADDFKQVNVRVEMADPRSMFSLTRRLLSLRRSTAALNAGKYVPVDGGPEDCYLYLREAAGGRCLIALNFGGKEQTLRLAQLKSSGADKAQILVSTTMDRDEKVDLASFTLRPNEGCILEV